MELLKLLSANEIVAQVLSFLLLLFLLRIFAWKRILGLLDERRARITSEFKNIADTKADIEKIKSDYASRMGAIEEAANLKIKEAISEGKKITEEMRKKAHDEAMEIVNSARESLKQELSKAKEELRNEVVDLTIRATEAVIQEKLTKEGDKKLVKDFVDGLDKI